MQHQFWMVWNEQGRSPTYKHNSKLSAETEAERLARLHPAYRFHVLEWVGTCAKNDVIWRKPDNMDDDIPF